MNKIIQILIGLIILIGVILLAGFNVWNFGTDALIVLKGGLIWIIGLIGLLFIIIGINELKE